MKSPEKLVPLVKVTYHKFPKLTEALKNRHIMYNNQTAELGRLEKEGKVLILAPEKDYGIHRTERKPEILLPYEKEGYDYAVRNMDKIKGFIS